MVRVKCEKLDLDGNGTGIFKEFDKTNAKIILNSKAFGNWKVVKEASKPKEKRKEDKTPLQLAKDEYKKLTGKNSHYKWDIDKIKTKISESK